MENLEIHSQSVSIPSLSIPQISTKQGSEGSLEGNGLERLLPISLRGIAENLETMKSNSEFKYQGVLEMVKNQLGNAAASINSILTARGENASDQTNAGLNTSSGAKLDDDDEDVDLEEMSDEDSDLSETESEQLALGSASKKNLVDNVKENLDSILQADSGKKKFTEKRWWTPEEDELLKKVVRKYGAKNWKKNCFFPQRQNRRAVLA